MRTPIIVEYTDEPVTPWGGMAEMKLLIDKTGIRDKLSELPLPSSSSNNHIPAIDIIESFWVPIWIGCFRFSHTAVVRMDEVLRQIFGWKRVASGTTFGRFFKKFSPGSSCRLFEDLYSWFFEQLQFDNYTLDVDSSVITRYGEQEGSLKGYNPKKPGRASHQARDAWMAQLAMYHNLIGDSSLSDSSVILQDFVTTATNSRFDWIVQLGNAIGNGQDSLADTLLAHAPAASGIISGPNAVKVLDGPGGDSVFAHYKLFYELYTAYRDSTFNPSDSAALCWLASLCPRIDGAVVFQARSLRVKLSNEVLIYPDDCPDGGGGEEHFNERRIKTTVAQQYRLLPNPSDGNITLLQKIPDAAPVVIKVYNSIGAVVFSSSAIFEGSITKLNLSNIPIGIYYFNLLDKSGESFSLQLIKK